MACLSTVFGQEPYGTRDGYEDNQTGVDDEEEDVKDDGIVVDDGGENRNDSSRPVGGIFLHFSSPRLCRRDGMATLHSCTFQARAAALSLFTATESHSQLAPNGAHHFHCSQHWPSTADQNFESVLGRWFSREQQSD